MQENKVNKKNILLISSNFEDLPDLMGASQPSEEDFSLKEETYYPLGIAYIHSYLESKGFKVDSLSFNSSSYNAGFKEVKKILEAKKPKFVGFQMLTANRHSTLKLTEYINKNYPETRIILGGIHATIFYERIIKEFPFVYLVVGEGEETFLELVEKLNSKKSLREVKGLVYNEGGRVKVNPSRPLIENLDKLPFPKHEAFFGKERTDASILTTRGCPFACSFCCLKSISKRRVRYRSVKNVVDEIEYLVKNFPQLKEIMIQDDSFFLDNERVIKICEEVIRRKIKIHFTCSGRMKPLSKKMIKKLEEANFKRVLLGLETGDPDVLQRTHKGITPEDAINAFKLFRNSPIELHAFLIVGLPGENKRSIENTIKLIKTLQRIKYMHYKGAPLLAIYPGTEIYEIAKKEGIIDEDFWFKEKGIKFFTVENDIEKLKYLRNKLLDNIAFTHLKTWKGFKSQLLMIPFLVKYTLLYKRNALWSVMKKIF